MSLPPSREQQREKPLGFRRSTLAALALAWVTIHTLQVHDWLPGAFFAVVPFALGIVGAPRRREAFCFACVGGWVFFMTAEYFLGFFSWSGLAVMAFWQAATLAPVALGLRWLHGRWGWPLTFALPVVWVGGEFLRNLGPLALPTGLMKAPCYGQLWMIQVCDLAGVYGLDFALAMVNGLLADASIAWLAWWRRSVPEPPVSSSSSSIPRRAEDDDEDEHDRFMVATGALRGKAGAHERPRGFGLQHVWKLGVRSSDLAAASATLAVWLFIPAYGWYRLSEAKLTMRPGPVLAVVQPDIPYRAGIANGFDPSVFLEEMLAMSEQALAQRPPPALLVWPEALSTMPPLNAELLMSTRPLSDELAAAREHGRDTLVPLRQWVERKGVPLLLGSLAWLPSPTNSAHWSCYNSGMTLSPGGVGDAPRQFKLRLFPGGEQIPGRGTFIHDWLHRIIDWSGQIQTRADLEPGERREVFRSGSGPERFIITICYEMLFANSSGAFLASTDGRKPFDFLVNISNDGIFQRSRGQMVHWRVAPFRAVESRVGIVRAANTGISAFVKPTGEVYGEVKNQKGQIWTGLGAPELTLIGDVVKRREHETDLLRNPKEYRRLTNDIARISALRRDAGICGQSTQPVYLDTRRTLYSRMGDVFAGMLLTLLMAAAVGCVVDGLRSHRRITVRR